MVAFLGLLRRRSERIDNDVAVRASRDVLTAERDGVAVLLDLRREVYLGLDEVGSTIWRALADGGTPAAAAQRVADEFDAPPDRVLEDTNRFVGELLRRRLLVRSW